MWDSRPSEHRYPFRVHIQISLCSVMPMTARKKQCMMSVPSFHPRVTHTRRESSEFPASRPFDGGSFTWTNKVLPLELSPAVCTSRSTRNHLCRSIRLILMPRCKDSGIGVRFLSGRSKNE